VHHPEKWTEFIETAGLEGVKIYDYYLGYRSSPKYSDVERSRAAAELFADAVAVGAIVLPKPYVTGDFEVAHHSGGISVRLMLETQWLNTSYFLGNSASIDGYGSVEFFDLLTHRVNVLAKEH
jgi:hypothetical protein